VKFRRAREGKTDYRYRLRLLRARKPRFVVRKTLRDVIVQLIDYKPEGDVVLASALGTELKKLGWQHGSCKNVPACYLTGYLAAARAKQKKIKEAVLDIGYQSATRGARVFAALKGALDKGLAIPHSASILPSEERLLGKHIGKNIPQLVRNVKKAIDELGKRRR
jgi:large subunit ribosomal protein L18